MKPLFSVLSRGGVDARLSTLIFHRVHRRPDELFPGEVGADGFDRICRWLREWFEVLPLQEAVRRLRDGELPRRAAAITFDDGYADNHDVALPILRRHGLPATFFVATGFLDGGRMWNDTLVECVRRAAGPWLDLEAVPDIGIGRVDLSSLAARRRAVPMLLMALKYLEPSVREQRVGQIARIAGVSLPADLMMSSQQVRAMHRTGMTIGAHTVSHPILARCDPQRAEAEIRDSRSTLEQMIDAPVDLFAYPNGKRGEDFTERDVDLVRRTGFAAALTTEPGVSTVDTDRHQLRRYTPWRHARLAFGLQLARNLSAT